MIAQEGAEATGVACVERHLWGRARAIDKSAAFGLDGLAEAGRRLCIHDLYYCLLPVATLLERHEDVGHSVDVEYVPAALKRTGNVLVYGQAHGGDGKVLGSAPSRLLERQALGH